MKTIVFTGKIVVDETHPNAPDAAGVKLALENTLETPDNESFGIKSVIITVSSHTEDGEYV